jgi:hypothetical protein
MVESEPEEGEIPEQFVEQKVNKNIALPLKRKSPPSLHEGKPYKKLPCKYFSSGTCHRGDS